MFATDGTERDPVAVYKLFARKTPKEINLDDAIVAVLDSLAEKAGLSPAL